MWRKSSYSEAGNCIEVWDARVVLVRDSQLRAAGENVSPILSIPPSAWTAFITEVRK